MSEGPRVRIVEGPIAVAPEPHSSPGSGAVVRFLGIVRPMEDGSPIAGLRYETYDPMAGAMLRELAGRVMETHGLHSIEVLHSRGFVGAGECSFQLDVGAPHRREAMQAIDDFVSTMKEDVPIWKHAEADPVSPPSSGGPGGGPPGKPGGLADPGTALRGLLGRIGSVDTEEVSLEHAAGRILGETVHADRDSPPADVSAMDGFAVRLGDLDADSLPIRGEAAIGQPVADLPPGAGLRIFTGAPVPRGAEAVIRREDVEEHGGPPADAIRLRIDPASVEAGRAIRRQGENGREGDPVVRPGRPLTAPAIGALASFGRTRPRVFRRVRVAVLTTGNEIVGADADPGPTGIRDSNGPSLLAVLSALPWAQVVRTERVEDRVESLERALASALESADAVLLTGGVSMGDHDHVPDVVTRLGGTIHFHRLAIRPGKPVLAATVPGGQLILGLPGNPVSVLATARRLALPALRRLAGWDDPHEAVGVIRLPDPGVTAHSLTRYLPVRMTASGLGHLVESRGSGDLVAAAGSHGIVEVPAGSDGVGPFPCYPWQPA